MIKWFEYILTIAGLILLILSICLNTYSIGTIFLFLTFLLNLGAIILETCKK